MWRCPKCEEQLPDEIGACWVCGTGPDGTVDPDFAAEEMPERRPRPVAAVPDLPAPAPDEARRLWIEVLVVVLVVVLPDVWWSICSLVWPVPSFGVAADYLSLCVRSIAVSALVLFVLWRSGEPWRVFGVSRPSWWDLVVGIVVALAVWVPHQIVLAAIWLSLPEAWHDGMLSGFESSHPRSAGDWTLVVTAQLANGIAEELSMRAYLLLRLRQLLGSAKRALVLSSLLFAVYHLYQGPWGCISAFVYGVLIGFAFLKIRRLWPVAVAHTAGNLYITLTS